MILTWLGHSCFKVEADGYTVIIDPYEDGSVPGLKPIRGEANLVLCSHEHRDHNARSIIALKERTKSPFNVSKIITYHDDKRGKLRGNNTIYVLDDGNNSIAHFGDLGCELEKEHIEQLKNVDVVLIPVGGYYTINALLAKRLVEQIQPRIVIPMHYSGDDFGYDVLGGIEDYIKLCNDVKIYPSNFIEITDNMIKQTAVLKLIG